MDKNNKVNRRLMAVVFLLFIAIMSVSNILRREKAFSEEENRNLTGRPEFSISSLLSGEYIKKYESYISDQFPGRGFFVNTKAKVDKLMGKSESNDVFIGKNNQLIEDFEERSKEETDEKVLAVNEFVKKHENINTNFMLIPTATEVLKEKLPKYAPVDSQLEYMKYIQGKLSSNIKFINPYDALLNNKDKYLYYKTDHHWTSQGAYIAYVEFCKAVGLEPKKEDEFDIELVANDFYGSLTSKIGVKRGKPDYVYTYIPKENGEVVVNYITEQKRTTSLYSSESLEKKDKYEVFTGGNHPHINIKSLGDPKKKLLIIKDSYANSFLPFLTSHYGEIDVVDLRYYMDNIEELIKSKGITDMLFLYNANTFNSDDSILNLN
ncbi:DHHW family protein [uncultured Clostridium sp.]|uniref:DHHW family protein n=1 Tax=uncultured Clostridium sp. TaxID=59620 RepID=UPI0032180650